MTSSHLLSTLVLVLLFVTSLTSADYVTCPAQCRCSSDQSAADCSSRQITDLDLPQVLADLDPHTSVLDLRHNQLTAVTSQCFAGVRNLSVLLLDNNVIRDVEQHAFRGLQKLQLLSLTHNRLSTVRSNTFSELSGDDTVCSYKLNSNQSKTCSIDLTHNDISLVDRHAFAWIKRLEVVLGQGNVPLTVDAYAFYGARWMPRFSVSNVPTLTLRPRIFTNTENVDVLEVSDTEMDRVEKFVFEGLTDVNSIVFRNVTIGEVQSNAFSAVQFRKPDQTSVKPLNTSSDEQEAVRVRRARYALSGGQIQFINCHIKSFQSDVFRDANVAHITLTLCTLYSSSTPSALVSHTFRGISGLHSLEISHCLLGPRLSRDTLSSLRGLRRLRLIDNDFYIIEPFAFREVVDVDSLHIKFHSMNVTLMTESFAHVTSVGELELRGGRSTRSSELTALQIDVGAFRNLVDVSRMSLVNFRLPVLQRYVLGGLNRVGDLSLVNCGVHSIERDAFSDSVSNQVGAVRQLDLSVGNNLQCTCTSTAALQRELERSFSTYIVPCFTQELNSPNTRVASDIRQVSLQTVCEGRTGSAPTLHRSVVTSLITATLIVLLLR